MVAILVFEKIPCQLKDGKLIDRMLSKSKVFLNDEEGTEDEAGKSK